MACSDAAVTREPRTHRNSRTTAWRTARESGCFREIHGSPFGLPRSAANILEEAWCLRAPKRLLAEYRSE